MKEIFVFMEQTSRPYIKKIIIVYGLLFVLHILAAPLGFSTIYPPYPALLFMAACLILFGVHKKRFKNFAAKGGFTRITLLPVRPTSFLFSELLLLFTSFLGIFVVQILASVFTYFIIEGSLPYASGSFLLYVLATPFLHFIFPMTLTNIMFVILFSSILASATCVLLFVSVQRDSYFGIIALYFLQVFLVYGIMVYAYEIFSHAILLQNGIFLIILCINAGLLRRIALHKKGW